MNANFYAAMLSFAVGVVVTVAASRVRAGTDESSNAVHPLSPIPFRYSAATILVAGVVLIACIGVNFWLR
jgi:hypothetical protein